MINQQLVNLFRNLALKLSQSEKDKFRFPISLFLEKFMFIMKVVLVSYSKPSYAYKMLFCASCLYNMDPFSVEKVRYAI